MPFNLDLPIRAATETAIAHGLAPDRCDILQNSSTLVLRLSESLVARVVQDLDGPRQGGEWFARENAVARHLARHGAPVIPMHPDIPPGPHEHLGYTLNFWQYVTSVPADPDPAAIGATLQRCHEVLRTFPEPLPALAILTESHALLETLARRELFPPEILQLLDRHLVSSISALAGFPHQPLHGDAHPGNLMNTTLGLLWPDWEDTFSGPVEWDVASVIWNARLLDGDAGYDSGVLAAYREAGGPIDETALHHSLVGRACVMIAWYPILYPDPTPMRQSRLQRRIEWLRALGR
ncbi:MAG: Thiamine kinase [Akkermansiaceae bacterium]|nr:Thiamine kinase [Akkermansiaceae bacterium]